MNTAKTSLSVAENASKPPLYQQIYLLIRDRIMSGEYPDQSLLPTEHEASELFGVSRITAKRALNEIAADGLCIRKRGQGSVVTYKLVGAPLKSDAQGLLDVLGGINTETDGRLLEFDYRPADKRIAKIFEIDTGAEVQRSVRLRSLDGKPLSYLITYVPADLGQKFDKKYLKTEAVISLLEKTGVKVKEADQTITAVLAEVVAAKALNIKQGSPLLRVSRIVRDVDDQVVEYIIGLYRPDRFQYGMSLTRNDDGIRQFWTSE
jgi:GntR family transcriptional regulator